MIVKKISNFKIKTQPNSYCLSTIESTQYILELLNRQKLENLKNNELIEFTKPFEKMVQYQIDCAVEKKPRYR